MVAQTFGNQFLKAHGNYPVTNFKIPGWIHPPKAWWRDLTLYILAHFEEDLERLGLYEAIRATYYGIQMSVANSMPSSSYTAQLQGLSSPL